LVKAAAENYLGDIVMDDKQPTIMAGFSHRSSFIDLVEGGAIAPDDIDRAIIIADFRPNGGAWQHFISNFLLVLGGLALAFSVMFFVAYNWSDIGKFAQFGMVELFIVLSVASFLKLGADALSGKISLLVGAMLVGVLLALHGQTYQTGADPWELFFFWMLLIIPWALIGRFPALWLVWLGLANVTLFLFYDQRMLYGAVPLFEWSLIGLNTVALLAWECAARRWIWLLERWAIRIVAMGSGSPLTFLVVQAIFEPDMMGAIAAVAWVAGLVSLYVVYRKRIPDLFMLAGACLSVISVMMAGLSWLFMDEFETLGLLIIAVAVSGAAVVSAKWLRHVQQELKT
jgi:uncharacterized membrane protein